MSELFLSLALALSTGVGYGSERDDLRAALEQRFKGDRSGACIAAAVIENGTTARVYILR
jgi:serine-type D-Ala-D-Ala carboxypeptidase/endopeptidase